MTENSVNDPARALAPLDDWARTVLQSLAPGERARLLRRMGQELRKANAKRITAQQEPDGAAWAPRKRRAGKQKGKGTRKMFLKLRQTRHFKVMGGPGGVEIGFSGNTGRLARIHHFGLRERMERKGKRSGPLVKYEGRQLLGLSGADREHLHSLLTHHISETPK